MALLPRSLTLCDEVRNELETLVARHSTPQQIALRANIVLLADQGLNHHEISRRLNVSVDMAKQWRMRWLQFQDVAIPDMSVRSRLADAPRPGKPPRISAEAYCQIMAIACQPPEKYGRPITEWTERELADEAILQGVVQTISPRQVGRFLKRCGSKASPRPLLADGRRRP